MIALLLFSLVAGALTAVTPCVLPVLPALLSAAGTGGRRRPAGVVTGLVITHFLTIVALASVVDGVGLADGATRMLAIVVLAVFGTVVLLPRLALRVETWLAPLTRFGPKDGGDGFASGLLVGGALGFAYAPCAGPILAAVISVSATQGAGGGVVAVAAAYSLGSAVALLVIALGGRKLLAPRAAGLQRVAGVAMLLTAVAMTADLDTRFQTALANDLPSFVSNPTKALEETGAVQGGLEDLRGRSRFSDTVADKASKILRDRGPAPELRGTQEWFNSSPLSLASLRGRVVLVDFWTYSCINCIRTLPTLRDLDARYRDDGLTVIGIHTPEFRFERDAGNVRAAVDDNELRYPVVQDNDFATWEAFDNQAWPTKYLIDARGRVRYVSRGEGHEERTEAAIRALLAEAGTDDPDGDDAARPAVERAARGTLTRETYFGAARAAGFVPEFPQAGRQRFRSPADPLPLDRFAFRGTWTLRRERATAGADARLLAHVRADRVFVVAGTADGRPATVEVLLDGRPLSDDRAGADVRGGRLIVREQRLYRLIDLEGVAPHRLELRSASGTELYAMTFG